MMREEDDEKEEHSICRQAAIVFVYIVYHMGIQQECQKSSINTRKEDIKYRILTKDKNTSEAER
jgi:hypothetical protein